MTTLIVTHSEDNYCTPSVLDALKSRGERVFRFDTDRFPTEVRLALHDGDGGEAWRVTDGDDSLDLGEVTAVWYRRSSTAAKLPKDMDRQLRSAASGESQRTVQGMLAGLGAFTLDPIERIRAAEHKPLQLRVAERLGLEIPRTLVTNDPDAVRAFAARCAGGMITKMLSSFAVYEDGKEMVVFTNPVTAEHLDDLEGLELCPMCFQESVPKALELRVTVVGDRVFAASIDSQSSKRARHDWRRDGNEMIADWKRYELPAEVTAKVLRLMDHFRLNYGAIDIIVTPDGRYVFLEINPAGEFFWLERAPGLPISEALADVLTGRAPRRA